MAPRLPQALAEWAGLAERFAARPPGIGTSALPLAAAAEEGLALLSQQAQQLADPLQLELDEAPQEAAGEPAVLSLDELAEVVRQQHPSLFPSCSSSSSSSSSGGGSGGSGSSGSSSSSSSSGSGSGSGCNGGSGGGSGCNGGSGGSSTQLQAQQALALADVLYRQQRFKHEPFEWVYEGLHPLLLPQRLQRRKLAPLTLATVAAGVARRLGLPLLPVPGQPDAEIAAGVEEGPAGGAAAQGGLPLEQLRPDVAQRYAGRASAAAPEAGPWLLLLPASGTPQQAAPSQQTEVQWQQAMDACTGQLLGCEEVRQRYPALRPPADPRLLSPLLGWQHMVRTVIQVGGARRCVAR